MNRFKPHLHINITKKAGRNIMSEESYQESTNTEATIKGDVATVGYSAKFTKNLGSYQSMQVGVYINYPCEANEEAVEQTYGLITKIVDDKLEDLVDGISKT